MAKFKQKAFKEVEELVRPSVEARKDDLSAYNMLGVIYLAMKQEEEAGRAFEEAMELSPGDPSAGQNLAALAIKEGLSSKAREYLKQVIEDHPGHLMTLLKLAALEASQGNSEVRKEVLVKAMEANPQAEQPRLLLARQYLREDKAGHALAVLGNDPNTDSNSPAVLGMIGETHLALKNYTEAQSVLQRLVGRFPGFVQGHFLLAQALGRLKDRQGMQRELQETLRLEPDHFPARIALIRSLIADGKIAEARDELASLDKKWGDHPDVVVLRGAVAAGSGDSAKALSFFRQLFDTNPSIDTLLTLTRFQWSIGERDASIAQLEQWLAEHPDDIKGRLALANSYIAMNRQAEGIGQYRMILKTSENDLVALNNLAWNLRHTDPEQALVFAQKAAPIAPDSAGIMDTLASVLIEHGKTERAQRMLERALRKEPENPTFLYHKALLLEKKGEISEAREVVHSLLKLAGFFLERPEAEELLRHLAGS